RPTTSRPRSRSGRRSCATPAQNRTEQRLNRADRRGRAPPALLQRLAQRAHLLAVAASGRAHLLAHQVLGLSGQHPAERGIGASRLLAQAELKILAPVLLGENPQLRCGEKTARVARMEERA